MYYVGTFSIRGRTRVAAFSKLEEAWEAAAARPRGQAIPLRSREAAIDWLRENASLCRAEILLRAVEAPLRRRSRIAMQKKAFPTPFSDTPEPTSQFGQSAAAFNLASRPTLKEGQE